MDFAVLAFRFRVQYSILKILTKKNKLNPNHSSFHITATTLGALGCGIVGVDLGLWGLGCGVKGAGPQKRYRALELQGLPRTDFQMNQSAKKQQPPKTFQIPFRSFQDLS